MSTFKSSQWPMAVMALCPGTLSGFSEVEIPVLDAAGQPSGATIARSGRKAVLELASICGLPRGSRVPLDPERSSSAGVGAAVRRALDVGCDDLTVGLGGSASTDGGLGMLVTLGARLLDGDGSELDAVTPNIQQAARIDLDGLDPRLASARIIFAVDVHAPLLGPTGAAELFSPQKGADVATGGQA